MAGQNTETAASKAYSVLTLLYHRGMIRATRPQSADEDRAQTEQVRQLVWDAIVACERDMHAIIPQPAPDAVTEAAERAARETFKAMERGEPVGVDPAMSYVALRCWAAYFESLQGEYTQAFRAKYRLLAAGASEVRK